MSISTPSEQLAQLGISFFERGWLSSNNVLIQGRSGPSALVDSGYTTHSDQTLALATASLQGRSLDLLLNTHLHSDHCGGNAALQAHYPRLLTLIPPGHAQAVADWDTRQLTYAATGQQCPRFRFDGLLRAGEAVLLGDWRWEVHAAKGHDPHSIVLFQPDHRLLLSADALWGNGFGVIFPELEGQSAFDEVADTLDAIERLAPVTVIPGHGPIFQDVEAALGRARSRLARFRSSPDHHLRHAHKVLIKFRLLELQSVKREALIHWALQTEYLRKTLPDEPEPVRRERVNALLQELAQSEALRFDGEQVLNV